MPKILPKLRRDIDFLPSPDPQRPGLLLRDPYQYSPAILIVPPVLVPALGFLDGQKTDAELRADLSRRTGQLVESSIVENFVNVLQEQGFLETAEFYELRERRQAEFRRQTVRQPNHAGSAYASEPEALQTELRGFFREAGEPADPPGVIGVAAPHVSPSRGWRSYAAAYARLDPALAEQTFVILGTSHYGAPERFGLTRKPFVTPLGTLPTDTELVDRLAAQSPDSVVLEDYCHSVEHSVEFQCLFLQHTVAPEVRILPILCGPFVRSLMSGEAPEKDPGVERFFAALAEMAAREGSRLFWLLGIDLAHIGRRYGDAFSAEAGRGRMAQVQEQDRERLDRVCAGDRQGFFELLRASRDELRWCGYSAVYTFLSALPQARGRLVNYEQWNIDAESVVSFAALEFSRNGVLPARSSGGEPQEPTP